MKPRVVVIFAVFVLAVVAGAVWFLQSQGPAPISENATPAPAPAAPLIVDTGTVPGTPEPRHAPGPRPANNPPAPPPRELTAWERKIDEVLTSGNGETETAQLLINLLPTMPPEGQAEAAQHITNLILDKDYGRVMPMLRNPALAQEVQDVLVTDLMNREDPVKLPALLEVAKIPNHPYHEEAMTDLQIFLDQDNGTNWSKWDGAVREYLRKQAAEEAAANVPEPAPVPRK
ncbi:MAG TPA: hypothetical protein VGO11_24670 [Chthoniobacteraceae bacterium]|jgi:hypothetical protein|nr:hypothetical protein [Chthoniobacteraceae bacterium]